ncbi:hypothetical protein B0T16DRAFT_290286, partial [Cercophora newfieldiana]
MAPHADESSTPQDAATTARNEPQYDDYIQWKVLPAGGPLNRWSHAVTRGHDFPGAQVSIF